MMMKLQTEYHDDARALRAIGQDLAKLAPHSLELEVAENAFILRSQTMAQPSRPENGNPGLWRTFQDRIAHRAHRPAPLFGPFERKHTRDDVNRLDEAGIACRKGPENPPDISGLPEKLRMIGRIVNPKFGRLTKVIDDMDGAMVEYYDEQGELHFEKYSTLALHKMRPSYYGERGTFEPVDLWRGFNH